MKSLTFPLAAALVLGLAGATQAGGTTSGVRDLAQRKSAPSASLLVLAGGLAGGVDGGRFGAIPERDGYQRGGV